MYRNILGITLVASMSFFVNAGEVRQATIEKMMIDSTHGEIVLIRVVGNGFNISTCSVNSTWQFVMPLTTEVQKGAMTSFLLSAYMAGKKVRLIGSGICEAFSGVETFNRIELEIK